MQTWLAIKDTHSMGEWARFISPVRQNIKCRFLQNNLPPSSSTPIKRPKPVCPHPFHLTASHTHTYPGENREPWLIMIRIQPCARHLQSHQRVSTSIATLLPGGATNAGLDRRGDNGLIVLLALPNITMPRIFPFNKTMCM